MAVAPVAVAAPSLAPAIISGVGALGAGALSGKGAKEAAQTQAQSSAAALDFAKQQEANRLAAYKYEWAQRQNALKPFRQARAAVLAKYGITADLSDPAMPDFSTIPLGWKPGDQMPPGGTASDQKTYDKTKEFFPGLFQPKAPPGAGPTTQTPGPINPVMLANWSDWAKYGVPRA